MAAGRGARPLSGVAPVTTYLSRRSAVGLLRICLSQARNAAEESRIVAALSILGSEAEALAHLESRADLIESLVRALRSLPDEDRAIVLLQVLNED